MTSCTEAVRAAAYTSERSASGRAMAMFSPMVRLYRNGSCKTMPTLRRRLFRGILRRGFRYGFRICRFLHGVLFPAQLQDQLDRQRHANQQDQACSHSKQHGLSIARLFLSGSDRAAGSASAAVHIPIVIAVNRRLGGTEHILTAADRHPALAAEIPRRRELRPAVFAISFLFFSSHSFCLSRLL